MGGGFGGVKATLELSEDDSFEITMISDQEDFRYYPTLYMAALGGRKIAASIPLTEIFAGKPVKLVKDRVEKLDRNTKTIVTVSGKKYSYDYLVVSLGVVTNFFGIKGLSKYAYGIKTLDEAHELRDHLHKQLIEDKKPDVSYIIIGGGPTGVELAGALPAYIRRLMKNHGLPSRKVNVELVEAAPRLVPKMPKHYSLALQKRLRRLGVKLHLGQKVEAQTAEELMVSGKPINSHTVVWTAGVTNHPFLKSKGFAMDEHGKVIVDRYLQAEPGIYIIGDNAATPYSGMAQTALRDGTFVGQNLVRMASGHPAKDYEAKKPIYITPAGPRWAAMLWGGTQVYGWGGWIMRSLADFVGYKDLQPLLPASKRWLSLSETEEACPLCSDK